MAKNIEPTLKLISKYLRLNKTENFVIPEYQRSYSWGISQCDKLWQDIEAFIDSNASDPYFFGTIIVDCSTNEKFSLIDGQQRTTTFLLLLKALLLRLNEVIPKVPNDEDSEALKAGLKGKRNKIMSILFKAEDEDIPAMLKDHLKIQNILILENNSINELYPNEVTKIIKAHNYDLAEQNAHKIPRKHKDNKYTNHFRNFKYFYTKLGEKSESQLNKFAKIFLDSCQVIEIRSWQIEQAITMFNSLNSTGIPLSDADIISAQLYSNASKDRTEFNNKWEYLSNLADELSIKRIVDLDAILQQFMYVNRAINKEYTNIREDGKESVDITTPGLRRYYTEIKKELLNDPLRLCEQLINIANIWDKIKDYPTVKLLLKFNENAKLFLISYLNRYKPNEISEDSTNKICECLLRLFTILELSDLGYSSSKFKSFLFKENIRLVDNNFALESIKIDFDHHIRENWKSSEIKKAILDYEKNILVFLNEFIYSKVKNDYKFNFADNVNIEHIMPSSGRNIAMIQHDAEISDKEEFNSLVNKIGNKILLEQNINKSISNEWFKSKKQNSIKDKTGYKDSKYALASALTSFPKDTWTKQDIDNLTQKAAERIVNFIFDKQIPSITK